MIVGNIERLRGRKVEVSFDLNDKGYVIGFIGEEGSFLDISNVEPVDQVEHPGDIVLDKDKG